MKAILSLLVLPLLWAPAAYGCPAWWETYKPNLYLFGVGDIWQGPPLAEDSAVAETLEGWRVLTGIEDPMALKALVYNSKLSELEALRAEALKGASSGGGPLKSMPDNKIRLAVLDYLVFLRRSETAAAPPDVWEYRPERPPTARPASETPVFAILAAEAESAAARADLPPELRRRYIYQIFNFGFSAAEPGWNDKLKDLFHREVAAWPDDEPIKQWCRSRYAGLLNREGDLTGAFKEFAQVYTQSGRGWMRAHESLHLILKREAGAGLQTLARSDLTEAERKAVQQTLNSFNPDLTEILTVSLENGWPLPADIHSRLAGVLRLENDRRLLKTAPSVPEASGPLEEAVLSQAAMTAEPVPWLLAGANLAIQRGDAAAALKLLGQVDRVDRNQRYQAQRLILKALNRAHLGPLDRRGEALLFSYLSQLLELSDPINQKRLGPFLGQAQKPSAPGVSKEVGPVGLALVSLMSEILPNRYTAQSRDDRAALCLSVFGERTPYRSGSPFWKLIQSPPARLLALAETLARPQTPYEKFLAGASGWGPEYPLEVAGSYYIRTHSFDRAVGALSRIPQDKRRPWAEGFEVHNPFSDNPLKFHTTNGAARSREVLLKTARGHGLSASGEAALLRLTSWPSDRLEFARQMAGLKALGGRRDELGALALVHYAQALYNISWHGQSWPMSAWGRSSYDEGYGRGDRQYPYYWLDAQIRRYQAINPDDQYHRPTAVRRALTQALDRTDNPELRARIELTLAALPDRNQGPEESCRLRELGARYSQTDFVQRVRQECSRLKDLL